MYSRRWIVRKTTRCWISRSMWSSGDDSCQRQWKQQFISGLILIETCSSARTPTSRTSGHCSILCRSWSWHRNMIPKEFLRSKRMLHPGWDLLCHMTDHSRCQEHVRGSYSARVPRSSLAGVHMEFVHQEERQDDKREDGQHTTWAHEDDSWNVMCARHTYDLSHACACKSMWKS